MINILDKKIYIPFKIFAYQFIFQLILSIIKKKYFALSKKIINNKILVLAYHQIEDTKEYQLRSADKFIKVSKNSFKEQMKELKKTHEIIFIKDIYENKVSSYLSKNKPLACVTFDDGHISYSKYAVPLMKELGIKSTVYLISDIFLSKETPNEWWDYLWKYSTNSKEINLSIFIKNISISKKKIFAINFIQKVYFKSLTYIYERISLENQIKVDRLISKYKVDSSSDYINKNNIQELKENKLVTFGCHSKSHRHLSKVSEDQLKEEIINSKLDLENEINSHIQDFCFPYGRESDIGRNSFQKVSENYRSSVISSRKLPLYIRNTLNHICLTRLSINGNYSIEIFKKILKKHSSKWGADSIKKSKI